MTDTPAPDNSPRRADREDALAVVRRLREAGHVAYFAGGCVRDQLLGLEPKDYDVATDAPPDRVRQLFANTQAVGAAFGVILVRQRKSQIEVATFRTDGKYVDGRRPEGVTFTTAEEDAQAAGFHDQRDVFRPDRGQGDRLRRRAGGSENKWPARDRRARISGSRKITCDCCAAVRFAARFDFEIEAGNRGGDASHAEHLKRISPERIAEELRLMLTPPTRARRVARCCRELGR